MKRVPSLEEIFLPGGILDQKLPDYEFRPSQLEMARAVLEAIEDSNHLCVEAGTGTGKTLSYLLPALFSQKRVIVSTATKNLQEQIFAKDIPFIREHILPSVQATYMKGRQNYLCLRRFYDQVSRQTLFDDQLRGVFTSLRSWLRETDTGDRSELTWMSDTDLLWNHLDARSDACTGQKCGHFKECYVTRMRQRAFESHVIIVNHALFFANLSLESDELGKVLPEFGVLVLDEAHEVEDVAADHFGRRLSNFQLEDVARQVKKNFDNLPSFGNLADRLARDSAVFFGGFPGGEGRHSLNFFREGQGPPVDLRFPLGPSYERLLQTLQSLLDAVELDESHPDEKEALSRRLERHISDLEEIFDIDVPENVYWFEKVGNGVYLHMTPIDISLLLREHLFSRADCTILTSATLTTGGTFEYIKERLGLEDPVELAVPGEFDYARQASLYVPRHMPEPRSEGYFDHLLSEIDGLLEITDGNAFLLFTSVQQMNRVFEALSVRGHYPLLCQGQQPKSLLLETFRNTPRAVLCATSSFWQGVDVRGDALRAVIIDKLPFQVPSEPLVAARIHRLEEEGRNSFMEYSVPNAIIALRQGVGRLIRSKKDTGILAILDARLRTRRYGELFLKSLPKCPVTDNMRVLENFFRQSVSSSTDGQEMR